MDETTASTPAKMKMPPKKIIMILGGLLALAVIVGGYFFMQATQDPQKEAKRKADEVIAKVGKLMVLPDETPTVATVTDPEKLKDQRFFANAKKGDAVLIYSAAQKAILYDPSINKIIEVAPVNLGGGTQ